MANYEKCIKKGLHRMTQSFSISSAVLIAPLKSDKAVSTSFRQPRIIRNIWHHSQPNLAPKTETTVLLIRDETPFNESYCGYSGWFNTQSDPLKKVQTIADTCSGRERIKRYRQFAVSNLAQLFERNLWITYGKSDRLLFCG